MRLRWCRSRPAPSPRLAHPAHPDHRSLAAACLHDRPRRHHQRRQNRSPRPPRLPETHCRPHGEESCATPTLCPRVSVGSPPATRPLHRAAPCTVMVPGAGASEPTQSAVRPPTAGAATLAVPCAPHRCCCYRDSRATAAGRGLWRCDPLACDRQSDPHAACCAHATPRPAPPVASWPQMQTRAGGAPWRWYGGVPLGPLPSSPLGGRSVAQVRESQRAWRGCARDDSPAPDLHRCRGRWEPQPGLQGLHHSVHRRGRHRLAYPRRSSGSRRPKSGGRRRGSLSWAAHPVAVS